MNEATRNGSLDATEPVRTLYLDLLKKCLTYYIWGEVSEAVRIPAQDMKRERFTLRLLRKLLGWKNFHLVIIWQKQLLLPDALLGYLHSNNMHLARSKPFDRDKRLDGRDWPSIADTMIGLKRLDNIQECIEDVLRSNVPGDVIETGVWRGGASIFMRAVLMAHGVRDRIVWVADSFEGLPPPDTARYPADAGDTHHTHEFLRVTVDEVKANFAKYGVLDEQVRFLKGWFKDTLPTAPIDKLAVMRLDGDMYESTMDALTCLYPKLSVGGYVIIDDFGYWEPCRKAVHDYRSAKNIVDPIRTIDWTGAYWKRT